MLNPAGIRIRSAEFARMRGVTACSVIVMGLMVVAGSVSPNT
jgi:hypothetical protein